MQFITYYNVVEEDYIVFFSVLIHLLLLTRLFFSFVLFMWLNWSSYEKNKQTPTHFVSHEKNNVDFINNISYRIFIFFFRSFHSDSILFYCCCGSLVCISSNAMRDKPLLYENTIRNIKYTQWELSIWMSDLNGNNNNHKQYMNREPCRKMPEQKQEREKMTTATTTTTTKQISTILWINCNYTDVMRYSLGCWWLR